MDHIYEETLKYYNLRQTFSVFIPPQDSNASPDQQFRHETDLDNIVYSLTIKLLKPDCDHSLGAV